jgi:TP901 family phage tail tape measure protein
MTVAAVLDVVVGASTQQLQSGLRDADRRIGDFAQSGENRIGQFAARVGALAGGAILGIGGLAINAASDWESAFADVEKTVDASAEQLEGLEDILRNMATDEVLGSLDNAHTTLAGIAASAGALGVETDAIDEFTASVAALDVASDLTAESAANFAARFANVTGLDIAVDIDNLADTVVTLGNSMAATESDIASFGERLASLSAFGWDPADILGYGAAMASLGLSAELGSSNFVKSVTDMTTAVANGTPELATYAATAGMTADEFQALANSDPEGAFNAFLQGLSGMDIDSQLATLQELGVTSQEQQRVLLTLAEGYDTVAQGVQVANEAWAGNGAALAEAEAKADTLAGATNRLHNSLNEVGIQLGEKFVPGLADVSTGFSEILAGNYEAGFANIGAGLMDIASGIGEIATGAEDFDFQTTLDQWNFAWMGLQTVTQNIMQDIRLFFLDLELQMTTGLIAVWEAVHFNGMHDEMLAGLRLNVDTTMAQEEAILAARAVEEQLNAAMLENGGIDLTAPVTFDNHGEITVLPLEEVLVNPEIIAEMDPFTLESLRQQITQNIQDAMMSRDANELALNMEVAANLGLDGAAIMNDTIARLEAEITAAAASGDVAALEALIPAAIALDMDIPALVAEAKSFIKDGLEADAVDATVTVNLNYQVGQVISSAVDNVLGQISGSTVNVNANNNTSVGGTGIPVHHDGGIFEAPHGQSEGIALLEDGEVIRTSGQESALASRMGGRGGGAMNVTVYGSSPWEVLEMTQRAAADAGYD